MTERWFEAFLGAPEQAVTDLFSGRAGVGSNLRLDVPELLYQAFPPNLADERAQLDEALLSWLLGMREDYAKQVGRLGFAVYGKRVGDALIALQLLELPEAKRRVRADLDPWLRWLMPLRLHTQDQVATELAATLQTTRLAQPHHSTPRRPPALVPATQEEWAGLEADILSSGQQPETLAQRLFELLERNHEYAAATGVSHFFVRTLHNLGTSLLENHQLGQPEMTRFGLMIERALVWEPTNSYCWMLWADWFRSQGHQEAHEWTLREMLRLFPSDLHARVELGRLLIARGEDHWVEAEHWLRQAMERNPGGGHSRVVMARLLVLSHRRADAEALLAEFLKRHPDNPTARQSSTGCGMARTLSPTARWTKVDRMRSRRRLIVAARRCHYPAL